jgi:hypothetical protein
MSAAGLVFGLLVIIAAIIWIGTPFLRRDQKQKNDDALLQKQRERLLLIYERVLTNIRDLDEDHSTGKMQTTDYEIEREAGVQRGIQVLKALDRLDDHEPITDSVDDEVIDHAIDDEIEQAIAAYRTKAQP